MRQRAAMVDFLTGKPLESTTMLPQLQLVADQAANIPGS